MPEQPDNLFGGKLFTECTVLEQFSYSLHGLLFVSSNTAETKKLVLCCEIVSPPHLFYFLFFILFYENNGDVGQASGVAVPAGSPGLGGLAGGQEQEGRVGHQHPLHCTVVGLARETTFYTSRLFLESRLWTSTIEKQLFIGLEFTFCKLNV